MLKLGLLAEAIIQDTAARLGITLVQPSQAELLSAVDVRLGMDAPRTASSALALWSTNA